MGDVENAMSRVLPALLDTHIPAFIAPNPVELASDLSQNKIVCVIGTGNKKRKKKIKVEPVEAEIDVTDVIDNTQVIILTLKYGVLGCCSINVQNVYKRFYLLSDVCHRSAT